MAKKVTTSLRKSYEEVVVGGEPEIRPEHVNDWHYCDSKRQFEYIQKHVPKNKIGLFNLHAAISNPKSIKYRQRDCDFAEGKRGDYLFVDQNGGRLGLPFKFFKLLFS